MNDIDSLIAQLDWVISEAAESCEKLDQIIDTLNNINK